MILVRLLPAEFRREYEENMAELVADYVRGQPPARRVWFRLRAAVDIVQTGLAIRLRHTTRAGRATTGHHRRRSRFLTTLGQDLRQTARSLRRDPGLGLLATLIVGLGVGASVTVFSVVNALVIRPLPFADADRLVFISNGEWGRGQRQSEISVQGGYAAALQQNGRLLEDVAGYHLFDRAGDHTLLGDGPPERLTRLRVTGNFFPLLGVAPQLGRNFSREETAWNGPPAVLLTHGFWTRRFGADPDIVGRPLSLERGAATIVGVLPPSFDFPSIFSPGSHVDFVAPFPLSEETNRTGNTLALIGRLAPGATLAAAKDEVERIVAENPQSNTFDPYLAPLRDQISGTFTPMLFVLAGAVALVMLIVCANLSNLLLARGAAREREIAIRAALGARRLRLIQQLLTESGVLAGLGCLLGLGVAYGGTGLVAGLDVNVPLLSQVRVDGSALGFALALAFGCGLGFGVMPAFRLSTVAFNESLKAGGRGTSTGRKQRWVRGGLVVAEVALACVLLVSAGLLTRSLAELLQVDPGFEPQHAIALRVDPDRRFPDQVARATYYDALLREVRAAPGVRSAGLTDVLPTAFNRIWCAIHPVPDPDSDGDCAFVRIVSEDYLRAMGLSLSSGRDFTEDDDATAPRRIILNDVLAETLWPEDNPIGQSVRIGREEYEVIGVVRGMRHLALDQEPGPEFFMSTRQVRDFSRVYVIARGGGTPATLIAAVRRAATTAHPGLPTNESLVIQELIDQSVSARRFVVQLLTAFAGFALVLASLGIYGVISYSVSQRERELGIRMALGSSAGGLQRRILFETLRLAAAGLTMGGVAAWGAARLLRSMLFEVRTVDPITYAVVPLLLIAVAATAGYLPARRASRVDPVRVLNGGE